MSLFCHGWGLVRVSTFQISVPKKSEIMGRYEEKYYFFIIKLKFNFLLIMYIITQIRVRHMVVKAIEDRYPKWEGHKVSTELDNMIQDILKGQLDEKFWEVMAATKSKKRKNIVDPPVVPDTIDVGTSTKRKKDKAHVDGCHASDMVCSYLNE